MILCMFYFDFCDDIYHRLCFVFVYSFQLTFLRLYLTDTFILSLFAAKAGWLYFISYLFAVFVLFTKKQQKKKQFYEWISIIRITLYSIIA